MKASLRGLSKKRHGNIPCVWVLCATIGQRQEQKPAQNTTKIQNDNDNDNDNDTLREVPHRSNEGLALQARVSGPWPHKKESVLQVKLALWQGAGTNCCGQSVVHSGELNVQGRKMTRNRTGCCCAEFTINSRNLQIRSNTHKRTRSTGSQEAPGETRKPGQRPRRNAVRPRAAIVPAA